jgi:hypothetical protein
MIKLIWQAPQYILGLLLLVIFRPIKAEEGYWYSSDFPGAISLGSIIIMGLHNDRLLKHEQGHSKQSLKWGPLYLIVIGIPSILTAIFGIRWPFGWPEDQADRLGGVER